ncbi:MAG: hypothetical protein ACFCD0_22970 [Gemmataceae bacterium]
MQRVMLGLAVLSIWSLSTGHTLAQKGNDGPKVSLKKVVKMALKAHGGREKLKTIQGFTMTLEGTVYKSPSETSGYRNTFSMLANGNTRSVLRLKYGDKVTEGLAIINQEGMWMKVGPSPMQQLPKVYWKVEMGETLALWEGLLLRSLADGNAKLTSLGLVKVKGPVVALARDCQGIKIEREGNPTVRVYIDNSRHQVVKMLFKKRILSKPQPPSAKGQKNSPKKAAFMTYELFFSNFQAEQGVQIPRKIAAQKDGIFAGEFEVASVKFETEFTKNTFAAPK